MNKLLSTVKKSLCKSKIALKAHSPEILVFAGTVGVVASAVLACRATLKARDILDTTRNTLDDIHEVSEKASNGELTVEYSDTDKKKAVTLACVRMGMAFTKLYAPSVILGTLSLASIITSHRILEKRNVTMAAAYTAIDTGFKQYRGRVIERFGDEVDKELKYGIKTQTITEKTSDDAGNESERETTIKVADPHADCDEYTRFFDDNSRNWTNNAEYNLTFLRTQEAYFNQKLIADGYVFLNDVYNALDLKGSSLGQIVGWYYDPENPNHKGDNYIDFGIYDCNIPDTMDFVNGYRPTVLLNFNVDGPIINKAFKK